jgi:hypothetical protein
VLLCSRTRSATAASADIAALGPGLPPQAAPIEQLTRHAQLAGSWYNPARSGEGFLVETLADGRGAVYWFGYDAVQPERQAWMAGIGSFDGVDLSVVLVRPLGGGFGADYRAERVTRPVWGTLRLQLLPDGTGQAKFTPGPASDGAAPAPVEFPIQRLTRPPAPPAGVP